MISEKLPTEIVLLIFSYLTAEEVFASQLISERLCHIVYKELHESRTWTITCDRDTGETEYRHGMRSTIINQTYQIQNGRLKKTT
jgi:hypothetical protein